MQRMKLGWIAMTCVSLFSTVAFAESPAGGETKKKPYVRLWSPTAEMKETNNVRITRITGRTLVEGEVRIMPDGRHLPFQLSSTTVTPDLFQAKGLVTHRLCENGSCGLPYQLSLTRTGRFTYDFSDEVPTTIPTTIREFTQLKGEFSPNPRFADGSVYLIGSPDQEVTSSFSAVTYPLGSLRSSEFKVNAPEDAAMAFYQLSISIKHPAQFEYYPPFPQHECRGGSCGCYRYTPSKAVCTPSPFIRSAYLVSPSSKRIKLNLYGGSSIKIADGYMERRFSTGYTAASDSLPHLSEEEATLLEEPIKGTWRVDLEFSETQEKFPVFYDSIQVEGTLKITPLKNTF